MSYMTIFGEILDGDEEDMCIWITIGKLKIICDNMVMASKNQKKVYEKMSFRSNFVFIRLYAFLPSLNL
jgi:hypothetical protein